MSDFDTFDSFDDFDDFDDPDQLPSDQLINELESIKGILDDDSDTTAPIDIPLLDVPLLDVPLLDNRVIADLGANTRLLNLNRIFEEESEEDHEIEPAAPRKTTPTAPRVRPDYSRDVLIQELVDEFVPQIEAALRERLSQLDDAALQQWKDRD